MGESPLDILPIRVIIREIPCTSGVWPTEQSAISQTKDINISLNYRIGAKNDELVLDCALEPTRGG